MDVEFVSNSSCGMTFSGGKCKVSFGMLNDIDVTQAILNLPLTDPRREKVLKASQFGASIEFSGENVRISDQEFTRTELKMLARSKQSVTMSNQDPEETKLEKQKEQQREEIKREREEREIQRQEREIEREEREKERELQRQERQREREEREKERELQQQVREIERAEREKEREERKLQTKLEQEHGAYSMNPEPGVSYDQEGSLIVSGGHHTFTSSLVDFTYGENEKINIPELEGADFSLYGSYINSSIAKLPEEHRKAIIALGKSKRYNLTKVGFPESVSINDYKFFPSGKVCWNKTFIL